MPLPTTETRPQGNTIDTLSARDAVHIMLEGQLAALETVRHAVTPIENGAGLMAQALQNGGSLVYAAAGSSGLMALADASELPGTFGIPAERIHIHMAGGVPADGRMPGGTEDDSLAAQAIARTVTPKDVVIALSASGTTPYAVDFAETAKARGAKVISIANNPKTALLALADVAICLKTPPEVIAGSTRLGAGTAQKAALNLMSTLMGVKLGHVYQGMMVNLIADNAKLIHRATHMVAQIAGVSESIAQDALAQSDGQVKNAILVAHGIPPKDTATILNRYDGRLDACFTHLHDSKKQPPKQGETP